MIKKIIENQKLPIYDVDPQYMYFVKKKYFIVSFITGDRKNLEGFSVPVKSNSYKKKLTHLNV